EMYITCPYASTTSGPSCSPSLDSPCPPTTRPARVAWRSCSSARRRTGLLRRCRSSSIRPTSKTTAATQTPSRMIGKTSWTVGAPAEPPLGAGQQPLDVVAVLPDHQHGDRERELGQDGRLGAGQDRADRDDQPDDGAAERAERDVARHSDQDRGRDQPDQRAGP